MALLGDPSLGAGGIFKQSGGALADVALPGDPAPGTPDSFTAFGDPALNEAGEAVFGGGFGVGADQGIFKHSGGALTGVAFTGDPAPGTGDMFEDFGGLPVLNETGEVAFSGGAGATHFDRGIFTGSDGTVTKVALPGDPAPGTPEAFSFFNYPFPVLNGTGEVAFSMVLGASGGEIPDPSEGSGVFVFDPQAALLDKILADGDMLEVAPGDVREVREVLLRGPSGNHDGRGTGFNDRGQAALRVVFADASEAIVRATPADAALDQLIGALKAASLPAGLESRLARVLDNAKIRVERDQVERAVGRIEAFYQSGRGATRPANSHGDGRRADC